MNPEQAQFIFQKFVETSSLGHGFSDLKGKIIYANPALSAMVGEQDSEAMVGKSVGDYYPSDLKKQLLNRILPFVRKEGTWHGELLFKSRQGKMIPTVQNISLVTDSQGEPLYFSNVVTDITERKKTEEQINRLTSAVEQSSEGLAVADLEGKVLFVNHAFAAMHGYTPEEIMGKDLSIFHTPEQMPAVEKANRQIMETGEFSGEVWHVRKNGALFPAWMHNTILKDEHNDPIGIIGTLQDITERKKAEAAERESQQKYQAMFETSKVGMALCRMDGSLVECNQAYLDAIGYTEEEALKLSYWDLTPEEFAEQEAEQLRSLESIGRYGPYEKEYIKKDGSRIPVLLNGVLVKGADGQDYIWSVVQDMTERKSAEETLRLTQFATDKSSIGIFWTNPQGRFIYANDHALKSLGYTREQMLSMHIWDIDSEVSEEFWRKNWKNFKQEKSATIETRQRRKDGSCFPAEVQANHFEYGGKEYSFAFVRDITESKQAKLELEREKELAEKYLNIVKVMIVGIDAEKKVVLINQKGCEILGYAREEILGKNWFDHFLPAGYRKQVNQVADELFAGEAELVEHFENPILTKGGEERVISWHNTILHDGQGRIETLLSAGEDITERKRIEKSLFEAHQLLEAVLNGMLVRVFWKDRELRFLGCNMVFAQDAGLSRPEDLIGKDDFQMTWRDQAEAYRADDREVIDSGQPKMFIEEPQTGPDGKVVTLLTNKMPLRDDSGDVIGVIGMYTDITEKKESEGKLRQERDFSDAVLNSLPGMFYMFDQSGRFLRWNKNLENVTGYTAREIMKMKAFDFFVEDDKKLIKERVGLAFKEGFADAEASIVTKAGQKILYYFNSQSIKIDGKVCLIGTGIDITQRKQTEENLRRAMIEKETLLKEVHHRVKNNLLTLYSLVNMQQMSLGDKKEASSALEDTKQRISAMGRVHRMLYLSKNFSEVDFAEYIRLLVSEVRATYLTPEDRVKIDTDLDPITFDIDMAIPCGLVINEILVNSFKHAFPESKGGRITISLKEIKNDIELRIGDDGIGIDGDPLTEGHKTLGLRLVNMLSKQLKAKVSYSRRKGSLFTIVFKHGTMK